MILGGVPRSILIDTCHTQPCVAAARRAAKTTQRNCFRCTLQLVFDSTQHTYLHRQLPSAPCCGGRAVPWCAVPCREENGSCKVCLCQLLCYGFFLLLFSPHFSFFVSFFFSGSSCPVVVVLEARCVLCADSAGKCLPLEMVVSFRESATQQHNNGHTTTVGL